MKMNMEEKSAILYLERIKKQWSKTARLSASWIAKRKKITHLQNAMGYFQGSF
jgi:hypothetical protein